MLLYGVLLNLLPDKFGHWYRKGREVSCAIDTVIRDVWLIEAFLNSSSHCILGSRAPEGPDDRLIGDRTDH